MRVSENTVKSRLNYARKAIKEKVLDYEKQGIKLYSLSPLPFLFYFLRLSVNLQKDTQAAVWRPDFSQDSPSRLPLLSRLPQWQSAVFSFGSFK